MKAQLFRAFAPVLVASLVSGGFVLAADSKPAEAVKPTDGMRTAIFAGGCFWCMEASFEYLKKHGGVSDAVSGYTGGDKPNPTYKEVSAGGTGHREAIRVLYDPKKMTYERLLEAFWSNIDPEDSEGQFCDKGEQYTSAIFYDGDDQRKAAEKSLKEYAKKMKIKAKIATAILPAKPFYIAEDFHQDFYMKQSERYESYKKGCGRDARLKEVWGDKAE